MKKVFDLLRVILSPAACVETSDFFKTFDGVSAPTSKGLNNQRLKSDALQATLNGPTWNDQIFIYKCFGALLVLKKDISKPSKARGRSTTFVICMILV